MMSWLDIFSWQVIILISGVLSGLSRIVIKDQVGRMGVFQMAFWQDLTSLIGLGVILVWQGVVWTPWILALIVSGLILSVGIAAFNSALREDMSGTTVLAYSLSQVGIIVSAILFLGEWRYFDLTTIEGIKNLAQLGLGLGGFWLYGGLKGKKIKWGKMMLLTVVINIASNMFAKYFMTESFSPLLMLSWQLLGMLLGDILFLIKRKEKVMMGWGEVGRAGVFSVLKMVGLYMYLYLMANQPISILSITRRMAIIASSLLIAWIVYGEHKEMKWRQWLGLGLGLTAFLLG